MLLILHNGAVRKQVGTLLEEEEEEVPLLWQPPLQGQLDVRRKHSSLSYRSYPGGWGLEDSLLLLQIHQHYYL